MKRHEFEQECLQMILDKKPEDFLEEFEYGDMKEFLADFLVSYAEYRNQPPLLNASIARVVAGMITYAATYSKHVDDTPTLEDIHNYHEDMKTHKWEARRDY